MQKAIIVVALTIALLVVAGCGTADNTTNTTTDNTAYTTDLPRPENTTVNNIQFLGEIEGGRLYFIHDRQNKVGIWYSVGHGDSPAVSLFVIPDHRYIRVF